MNATDLLILCLYISVWCGALAFFGWWADRKLDRERRNLPPPQRRTVVGQSHKPWM